MITIVVKEINKGRFEVRVNDQVIIPSARCPFFEAARHLIDQGFDSHLAIQLKHHDSPVVCMQSTIAAAAALTVHEEPRTRFAPFRTTTEPRDQ